MAKGNVLKDKKIIIYNKTLIEDDIGNQTEGYQPIHSGKLWAYVRQLSATEYCSVHSAEQRRNALYS